MPKIKVMPPNLANKIAAGEVVERPASVVKELVENAIDAGATKIDVYLEEAGIRSIRVLDNGSGMSPEDAVLAFERHATSKIENERDLFRIETLGFRGEALPSIASVSDLVLQTSEGREAGVLIHFRGGKKVSEERTHARKGTEVHVRHLFFNTPARLKYLKSINTELGYSVDFMNKIALSHPNIAFRLIHGDRVLLQTSGNGDIRQILASIYGLDVAKKIHEGSYEDQFMTIKVYLAEPEVYRTTRNYMTLMVNHRVVQNRDLIRAIADGYEAYLPIGKFPIAVVAITIDPLLIDVNVHPAKLDIRFSNHEQIRTILTDLVRKTLKEMRSIPAIQVREHRKEKNLTTQQAFHFIASDPLEEPFLTVPASDSFIPNVIASENTNYNDTPDVPHHSLVKADEREKGDGQRDVWEDSPVYRWEEESETKRQTIAEVLPKLYYIGQLGGTYLLAQNDEGLYLIDQHAAEERINYEYYLAQLTQNKNEYYELLVPETFEFSLNEALIIEKHLDTFRQFNIGIEKFGMNAFMVTKVPNWFNHDQHREYLDVIFQSLLEGRETTMEALFSKIAANLSCKRSIKANWYISDHEVQTLLDRLSQCQNPYRCPHGRPVVIHLSYHEIERLFKRTV